jgi:hypothetical protein
MANLIRRQGNEWTKEEIRTLKSLFRNNSNAEVAAVLERSPKAVERKAAKVGLKKTKKYLRSLGRSV